MPVAEPSTSPGRQAALIGLGALVALVTIIFMVTRLGSLSQGSDTVDANSTSFIMGDAEELAETIAVDGPILLPDASGGERDIIVQHLGGDPEQGWVSFAARPDGSPRDCFAQWDLEESQFVNTCDGSTYPPDGEGLRRYPVTITDDGSVQLNLGLG